MKQKRNLLRMIMLLAFAMAILIGMTVTANAETVERVPYLKASWDETTKEVEYSSEIAENCTKIVDSTNFETWSTGWYVVSNDAFLRYRVTVNGTVNLILSDGVTLETYDGITVTDGNTLNIYAQSSDDNAGTLKATGRDDEGAAIGGGKNARNGGNVNIHGGKIEAVGGSDGAGIGGANVATGYGSGGRGCTVIIYGGSVTASSNQGAGIGGGRRGNGNEDNDGEGGNVTVYGGSVEASGIVGIGGWSLNASSNCGTVTIHGGKITAKGNGGGAGIGGGEHDKKNGSNGANVTINGGEVDATGGDHGAGIGGGGIASGGNYQDGGNGGNLTINGGKVTATGNAYNGRSGAGIGGGYGSNRGGNGATVTINGGEVHATGGVGSAGIGGAYGYEGSGNGGNVTINGGDVTATGGTYEDRRGAGIGGGNGSIKTGDIALGAGVSLYGDDTESQKTRRATGPLDKYEGDRYIYMGTTYKKPQTVEAEDVEVAYGDTDKKVEATVTDPATGGGTLSYAVKEGSEEYINVTSDGLLTIKMIPSDGLAYVIATAAEIRDYSSGTKEVKIIISKADPKVTAPKAKTLTYNGQAQKLVTAGSTSGGELQYALGRDADTAPEGGWSTFVPTGTDAGTYYVWYKVIGDENYNDKNPVCVTVKISEKQGPTPPPTPSKKTARTVLVAKALSAGNTKAKVSWNNAGADRYVVYYGICGKSMKKYKTVNGKTRFVTVSKLRRGGMYKFRIVAQKKSGKSYRNIATSGYAHMTPGNVCGRYTNVKDLKVNRKAVNLSKGRTFTVKTSLSKVRKNKRLFNLSHDPAVRYITNDPGVAVVNSKGKITAKGKGTCYVYVQAVNGIWKTVKVTVR